jgi:hypothetical protein
LENKGCKVQILAEYFANNQLHSVDDRDFIKVKKAYQLCLDLLWVEEKMNIVRDNYYEWENEVKISYDFLISNQSDKPDCNDIMQEHAVNEIIVFNRRLSNILSSIRMYRDQVLHDLSQMGERWEVKDLKKRFCNETNRLYDNSLAYQLMEFLRNHMQHQGLIIQRVTAIIPFSKKICDEIWYFVEADYIMIKEMEKFEQKIKSKAEIENDTKWINLIEFVRQYYCDIIELHEKLRSITNDLFLAAINDIDKVVSSIYKDFYVESIAFYGKNDSGSFKDFLLQRNYISKLSNYRKVDIKVDKSRYYIEKKIYRESDKIKVSNSVRHSARYNT